METTRLSVRTLSNFPSSKPSRLSVVAKYVLPASWQIPQSVCDGQTRDFGKDRCVKCPLGGGCFEPRAVHQPIPLWVWLLFGATVALPLYGVLHPQQARSWYYSSVSDDDFSAAWRRNWYDKIFRDIGLEHPERVVVFETDALDHCTTLGMNGERGALIFIPKMLIALTNPDTEVCIPDEDGRTVFEGKVSQLTPELRQDILERTGVLLPDAREIRYVIGHEASHIFHNHATKASAISAAAAGASHFLLKLYNRWSWAALQKRSDFFFQPLVSRWSHLLVLFASTIAATMLIAVYQERQADMHSARQLHLKTTAIELTKKKQLQNRIEHQRGDRFKTASGNDLLDWEHPSVEKQIEYLSSINDEE